MNPVEGEIFIIDKPLTWSSFHVVKKIRSALLGRLRRAGVRKLKVGHAGTLDPLATGVMVVCTGRSTKRIDTLQAGVKEYVATIRLGATTPSFDLETPVDATYPVEHINRELVEDTLKKFTGRIEQVPPTYSACKVDGHRAYTMARTGQEIELKPKILVIDEIKLLKFSQEEITVHVVCSKGTYIRALARDIGAALGSGAHLTALRRTRVGEYTIEQALSVDDAVDAIFHSEITYMPDNGNEPIVIPPEMRVRHDDADGIRPVHKADIRPYSERNQSTQGTGGV